MGRLVMVSESRVVCCHAAVLTTNEKTSASWNKAGGPNIGQQHSSSSMPTVPILAPSTSPEVPLHAPTACVIRHIDDVGFSRSHGVLKLHEQIACLNELYDHEPGSKKGDVASPGACSIMNVGQVPSRSPG